MPDVSVILPVYNRETYVREALESVFSQTAPPEEVIVVDDGSTDKTPDVIRSFGSRVTYVRQENAGAGAARNNGILRATGDFLAFLDSDDIWPSGKTEHQLKAFEEDPELDLVFGLVEQFLCPSLPEPRRRVLKCPADPMPGFHVGTMMVRRSVFDSVGLFETHWKVGEFVSWFSRVKEAEMNIRLQPSVALRRRIHGSNMAIERREDYDDFARILKASIDRRRAGESRGGTRL